MKLTALLIRSLQSAARRLRMARQGGGDLQRRRWAIGLSFAGAMFGMVVGAYQTGLVRRLPDIAPGPWFDAEKVDSSDYAYSRLQTPDAMLMTSIMG